MPLVDHSRFASELLAATNSSAKGGSKSVFAPDRAQSRNTAKAIISIICDRLTARSGERPTLIANTTYRWKGGAFNCRTITDRPDFWSNMRPNVADRIHKQADVEPVAYAFASWNSDDKVLRFWAIPEPILYACLASMSQKPGGNEFTLQIDPNTQRIANCPTSPDLTPLFSEISLTSTELDSLSESSGVDALVKRQRAAERGKPLGNTADSGDPDEMTEMLSEISQALADAGEFDPLNVVDSRRRILASIVRRQGQPEFRQKMLEAYHGHCAISGCPVVEVLEAAHIVAYRGKETNHPSNGLLLRADLHTLFDLGLIAINEVTMKVLLAESLSGTVYEEYHEALLKAPDRPRDRPSGEALAEHRRQAGL